jgi:hypothetical protein
MTSRGQIAYAITDDGVPRLTPRWGPPGPDLESAVEATNLVASGSGELFAARRQGIGRSPGARAECGQSAFTFAQVPGRS